MILFAQDIQHLWLCVSSNDLNNFVLTFVLILWDSFTAKGNWSFVSGQDRIYPFTVLS